MRSGFICVQLTDQAMNVNNLFDELSQLAAVAGKLHGVRFARGNLNFPPPIILHRGYLDCYSRLLAA